MSREHHVNSNTKVHSHSQSTNIVRVTHARPDNEQPESARDKKGQLKNQTITGTRNSHNLKDLQTKWARHTPKHTPYGPYNLPHMVLSTKQGPEHA